MKKLFMGLAMTVCLCFATVAIAEEDYGCAEWATDMVDWMDADVSTAEGYNVFQALNTWCESR